MNKLGIFLFPLLLSIASVHAEEQLKFYLSRPVNGATGEALKPLLVWKAELEKAELENVEGYVLEVSEDKDFAKIIRTKNFPLGITEYTFEKALEPEKDLEPGKTYYWRVSLKCSTTPCPRAKNNQGGDFSQFSTGLDLFTSLEALGLKLQRASAGKDATEGARFGFLKAAGEDTVFTADFALFWTKSLESGAVSLESMVEGKLKSSESDAEDAWRFKEAVVVEPRWNFYSTLGLKYEADQDFEVRKLMFEGLITPGAAMKYHLGGDPTPGSPIDFFWRPYMSLDYGHTFRVGDSAETEDTVLRLYPRVRSEFWFTEIKSLLKVEKVFLNFDYTFYSLPLQDDDKTHHFFVGNFGLEITKNFGFALTYKKGNSPPKFEEIETFEGALTIRFGS